jgi:hypothetical protein
VELAQPAAEAGAGDEAAPAPADKCGADEARGVDRREAEEYLFNKLLSAPPCCMASERPRRNSEGERGV